MGKDSNLFQSVSIYNLNSKQDQIYNYKTSPWSSILFVRFGNGRCDRSHEFFLTGTGFFAIPKVIVKIEL